MRDKLKRFAPLALLVLVAGLAFSLDLHKLMTIESLRENHEALRSTVVNHIALSVLVYATVYALAVAISLPGATILTVTGGLLFGAVYGGALAVTGATIGATLVFIAAKTVIGDSLRRRAGPFLKRMEEGFRANAFNYLLFLRLVPAFPFWAVNLVPALAGVSLPVFAIATFVGIIPGTFVFAAFGSGLGDVFAAGNKVSLSNVLSPKILLAFAGLGVLALLPIVIRRLRNR